MLLAKTTETIAPKIRMDLLLIPISWGVSTERCIPEGLSAFPTSQMSTPSPSLLADRPGMEREGRRREGEQGSTVKQRCENAFAREDLFYGPAIAAHGAGIPLLL